MNAITIDKLPITSSVLDKLGFTEYDDENGNWGGRSIYFKTGDRIRIGETLETDDEEEGYGSNPRYIAHHFWFSEWYNHNDDSRNKVKDYELHFLHDLYELINIKHPECIPEFLERCYKANMKHYIEEYENSLL